MADDNPTDRSSPSSNPFFSGRGGFPFVFLPTTFATGFNFSNNPTHDQTTNESKEENKEVAETIDDDEVDRNDEKDDLRINQPKYSQLLKELDFSQTRMVDVTNLLSNEIDQQGNYLTPDENESPKKPSSNEKYRSLSSSDSSISTDEELDKRTSNKKTEDEKNFVNAVNEIENDLKHLTAVIEQASQLSNNKKEDKSNEQLRKTFDEDDDTSKQATQNYDLLDNEQEEPPQSSKSSKIPRLINRQSKSTVSSIDPDNQSTKQNDANKEEEQPSPAPRQQTLLSWESLFNGTGQPNGLTSTQPVTESHHSTPKKEQVLSSSGEQSKPRISSSTKKNIVYQTYQTTSSSSDSDSIVQHVLHRPGNEPSSSSPPPPPKQPTPPVMQPQTLRQDSQATLIDENLDDLSSQLKQVLDQERQTVNTSTKEERTIDGLGSMSFPLSTPDVLSADVLDNDISNQPKDDLLRRFSNQRTDYNQQRPRNPTNFPESSSQQRRKPQHHHHHNHHQRRYDGTNSRKTDDDWLTMLERLEHEHRARLEKQQQQYEDYMHNLEEKMKRRFDDYLTLTNGSQESRLDNHDDTRPLHRSHPSIPIDSNIGRYKTHSHEHQYRPLAKDLVSHYYPADSTLNILTSEKKRSNESNAVSREDHANLRTELPGKHARHTTELKSYHDYEIDEFKGQLNRTKMGQSSSAARQSMETIERINNENIRLHDEVKELRHSLKLTTDENLLLKRQMEELREQLNSKDLDLKNYHRTIVDLEQQLTEAENTKERQDEKARHAERQVFIYQEDNEKLKTDLNLTRERLLRLEERFREQENENESLRRQLFTIENDTNRIKNRLTDDHKLSTAMTLNAPTSRDYGRFTLSTSTKNLSSPLNSPRETNNENHYRHSHSPRPVTRITDYLNEKPIFPQPYVSPTRHVFSARKTSPSRRRVEPVYNRSSIDRQSRQTEQLEQKYDQLLKKKRDLESRLSRIPLRGLTNTDRQLSDVLEREIDRVDQQLASVRLELRKSNIYRPH